MHLHRYVCQLWQLGLAKEAVRVFVLKIIINVHIQKFETKYFCVVLVVVVLLDLKTGVNLIVVVKNLVHAFRKHFIIVGQME